jgi:hypothetical protein
MREVKIGQKYKYTENGTWDIWEVIGDGHSTHLCRCINPGTKNDFDVDDEAYWDLCVKGDNYWELYLDKSDQFKNIYNILNDGTPKS